MRSRMIVINSITIDLLQYTALRHAFSHSRLSQLSFSSTFSRRIFLESFSFVIAPPSSLRFLHRFSVSTFYSHRGILTPLRLSLLLFGENKSTLSVLKQWRW